MPLALTFADYMYDALETMKYEKTTGAIIATSFTAYPQPELYDGDLQRSELFQRLAFTRQHWSFDWHWHNLHKVVSD